MQSASRIVSKETRYGVNKLDLRKQKGNGKAGEMCHRSLSRLT